MMFRRARIRLTVLYIGLFALVLGVFSIAFYLGFLTILAPAFDIGPELTTEAFAEAAYQATVERIGLALVVANVVVVVLVGIAAWVLAARTLRPIDEAHARQRRFVADASHEMRTPLAAMRSSAESALAAANSTDELRAALAVVARSAERLTRITNDLLMLARSEELPKRRPEPIDLSVVVAETVESFAIAHPELPDSRLSLGEDLRVSADASEIGRIVANLLDNAIRYSGGTSAMPVRIVTRAAEGEALVEVADDGPGIPPAELDRIFEPFYRVHFDATSPEGNGLGLAIARSLAQRNGGRLIAESPPGAGATFRVSLPRIR
ncbi:MAG: sensor histidine kinase [Candidatus Limnocylindrales bacterium]